MLHVPVYHAASKSLRRDIGESIVLSPLKRRIHSWKDDISARIPNNQASPNKIELRVVKVGDAFIFERYTSLFKNVFLIAI